MDAGVTEVPLADLTRAVRDLEPELIDAATRVIRSGRFILGPEVSALEEELAAYLEAPYVVGVGNGTDALWLSLRAAGVGAGDAVLTTPFTFFATASAIFTAGAVPVFVDIDPDTFNIDVASLKDALSSGDTGRGRRLAAVVPVHLYGLAADVETIGSIADDSGIAVVEDAAQAMGSRLPSGAKVGTTGFTSCFSMFPTKNLGALGDAGCISTSDPEVQDRLRLLRAHGARPKYHHSIIGTNSRLDELQAALLRVKLRRLDDFIEMRREAAVRYNALLEDVDQVDVPQIGDFVNHSFHQYTVRVRGDRRDPLKQALSEAGIQSAVYYPVPLHLQSAVNDLGFVSGQFPEAEKAAREVLSLPIFPGITTAEQEYVASHVARFFGA